MFWHLHPGGSTQNIRFPLLEVCQRQAISFSVLSHFNSSDLASIWPNKGLIFILPWTMATATRELHDCNSQKGVLATIC